MQEEIWKDIPDYEGLYQASNLGRIKSTYNGGRILKPSTNGRYLKVNLCKNNTQKTMYIHTLVAITFLNHIPKGRYSVVDHIDNNSLNNNLDNLQIITCRENITKDIDFKGYTKVGDKYRARAYKEGKHVHIGYFKTKEKAKESYYKFINNEKF